MISEWVLVYKTFFMRNSTEHEISAAHNNKITEKYRNFIHSLSSDYHAKNVKMPTIGISTS